MTNGRLEAFSDGVMAVIITIVVPELKVPHVADLAALEPLLPVFLTYLLSLYSWASTGTTTITLLHAPSG